MTTAVASKFSAKIQMGTVAIALAIVAALAPAVAHSPAIAHATPPKIAYIAAETPYVVDAAVVPRVTNCAVAQRPVLCYGVQGVSNSIQLAWTGVKAITTAAVQFSGTLIFVGLTVTGNVFTALGLVNVGNVFRWAGNVVAKLTRVGPYTRV